MSENAEKFHTEIAAPVPLPAQPIEVAEVAPPEARLQSDLGNASLVAATVGSPPGDNRSSSYFQRGQSNAAIARLLIQRKAEDVAPAAEPTSLSPAASPAVAAAVPAASVSAASPLIIEDSAQASAGQMKKTEFLSQLRSAICVATEEALAGTQWSAAGCPYLDRAFAHYASLDSQNLERVIRGYVPEASAVASAAGLIPLITGRVRRSVTTWATSGRITGVPADAPVGLLGTSMLGAVGGAVSGALAGVAGAVSGAASAAGNAISSAGDLLFKERNGGAKDATDPQEVQAQLGAGQSLDGGVRSRMEDAYGQSFSDVQIHADAGGAGLSDNLNARAFTVGQHIAFGAGEYKPGTLIGDALIAHELAHVMQQRGAATAGGISRKGSTDYSALEDDADEAAVGAVVSAWGGVGKGLATISTRVMPSLKSGLRLQRCRSCTPDPVPVPVPPTFEQYRDRFNALWNTAPFNALPPAAAGFDASLDSRGPRTRKARDIFNQILTENPLMRAAYNANTSGIREPIDTYVGPEGLNLSGSPRLTALRNAFTAHPRPVPAAGFPALRASVQAAAAGLDPADRLAVERSNDWQRLINEYVTDENQRVDIRNIISPPAPAPPPGVAPPPGARGTPAQRTHFLATWRPIIWYDDGSTEWHPGAIVRYRSGAQNFSVAAVLPAGDTNPGLTLSVRAQILRGAVVVSPPQQQPFPPDQSRVSIAMPLNAPTPVPLAGDPLTFRVEILEPNAAGAMNVVSTRNTAIVVQRELVYTQPQAEAIAVRDDNYFQHQLLTTMRGRSGREANVAEAMTSGRIRVRPLTMRHDSAAYVAGRFGGVAHPEFAGYFFGTSYADSDYDVVGADGFSIGEGSGNIVINRTPDIGAPGVTRSDDHVITVIVHESLHNFDVRPGAGTVLEQYKTEFRAYWMAGEYGPPDVSICPAGTPDCWDTTYQPDLPPPGPKSPRANVIFRHLYGSASYPEIQSAYDNNTGGFREAVDRYLIPDGINLIASLRLEALRALIAGWGGADFPAFRTSVQGYMGIGPAPASGVLTAADRNEVSGNRAWRDLVESRGTPAQQTEIKGILRIP